MALTLLAQGSQFTPDALTRGLGSTVVCINSGFTAQNLADGRDCASIAANDTVGKVTAKKPFGKVLGFDTDGNCIVQVKGVVRFTYPTGSAPTLGSSVTPGATVNLGWVIPGTSDASINRGIVIAVDAVALTCDVLL